MSDSKLANGLKLSAPRLLIYRTGGCRIHSKNIENPSNAWVFNPVMFAKWLRGPRHPAACENHSGTCDSTGGLGGLGTRNTVLLGKM